MRKLRGRLILILSILVIVTSAITLLIGYFIRSGVIPNYQPVALRYIIYGMAMKDVILMIVAAALVFSMILIVMRETASPVRELNRAVNEIARGNYDARVEMRRDRIAEYGQLQNNFNDMARRLKNDEYLRCDFISGVSHELRTPLAVIEGYAELLNDESLSESERRRYAELIACEAARLSRLSSNMLRLVRIDSEAMEASATDFMLDEQIRGCVIALENLWQNKGLSMNVELAPIAARGDELLLAQVWTNLLENAIKFSDASGEIVVHSYEEGSRAVVTIEDFGCGMDQTTLSRCFDQFYQGDTSHKAEGSGLGLALVKRIVEFHGGTVSAASSPEIGTLMRVELPIPTEEAQERRGHRAKDASKSPIGP